MSEHLLDVTCSECGGNFRMVWLSGDPPEPYGLICDCPNPDLADARAEKATDDLTRITMPEGLGEGE